MCIQSSSTLQVIGWFCLESFWLLLAGLCHQGLLFPGFWLCKGDTGKPSEGGRWGPVRYLFLLFSSCRLVLGWLMIDQLSQILSRWPSHHGPLIPRLGKPRSWKPTPSLVPSREGWEQLPCYSPRGTAQSLVVSPHLLNSPFRKPPGMIRRRFCHWYSAGILTDTDQSVNLSSRAAKQHNPAQPETHDRMQLLNNPMLKSMWSTTITQGKTIRKFYSWFSSYY